MWVRTGEVSWEHGKTEFRGTPRQCVSEYQEFRRRSGVDTAVRVIDGPLWDVIKEAVSMAEMRNAYE